MRSLEVDLEHFPLLQQELALGVSSKRETWLRRSDIFSIVVTNRELCIWTLFVRVVHDADVTATENGSFVGVVGYGELSQV